MEVGKRLTDFYAGKKVFLTGHTGFKGTWLLLWLNSMGARIKGFSLHPENDKCLYDLVNGHELCQSIIHDILDAEFLENQILDFEPDIIFHLAAQALVGKSYLYPKQTFETNFTGTLNVLEAVRKTGKPCTVVVITTDKVYENREANYAYNENDKLGGYDPYSSSKAAAELVVHSYRNSFFNASQYFKHHVSLATARAGNVIGGGDYSVNRIIPDLVKSINNNQILQVRNPRAVRPWQFVLEPLFGYLVLAERMTNHPGKYCSAYNFGPESDDKLTVQDLVEFAIHFLRKGQYEIDPNESQFHEAGNLQLDNSKAKIDLSVYPVYDSRTAIKKSLEWYEYAEEDYKRYCLNEIAEYVKRVQ